MIRLRTGLHDDVARIFPARGAAECFPCVVVCAVAAVFLAGFDEAEVGETAILVGEHVLSIGGDALVGAALRH